MTSHRRMAITGLAVVAALIAWTAAPAGAAYERDNLFFNNSGMTCIEGINATVPISGGQLQFQSATRSLELNCQTTRPLSPGYVTTTTGIRIIDGTANLFYDCGYFVAAGNSTVTSRVDAPFLRLTGAQIRSQCGVPAGNFAAAGAISYHTAVIWGDWRQTGGVQGAVSNLI